MDYLHTKAKWELAHPNDTAQDMYYKAIKNNMITESKALVKCFKQEHPGLARDMGRVTGNIYCIYHCF